MLPAPLDEYPIHQAPLSMRHVADERPQLLRPLLLQRARPHRRHLPGHRPRRVPEPRRHRRLRHRAQGRPPVGDPLLRRAGRTAARRRRRPLPHRGARAVAAACGWCATAPTTASASTSPGRARSPRSMEQHHVMRTGAARHPRRVAVRAARHVGGRAARRRRGASRSTPTAWVGTRDRSWGIRPVGEAEPPGRNADEPLEGFWWLYVPLRFDDFAVVAHRAGTAGRLPHAQRRRPASGPTAGSSSSAGPRSRSSTGPAPAIPSGPCCTCGARRQAVRHRGGDARLRRPARRRGLRR